MTATHQRSIKEYSQLISFLTAGLVNTGFNYLVYCGALWLGFSINYAVTLAYILGIPFSYNTIRLHVFKKSGSFMIFCGLYFGLYWAAIVLTHAYHHLLSNSYFAGLLATVSCAGISFLLNKWLVFR